MNLERTYDVVQKWETKQRKNKLPSKGWCRNDEKLKEQTIKLRQNLENCPNDEKRVEQINELR